MSQFNQTESVFYEKLVALLHESQLTEVYKVTAQPNLSNYDTFQSPIYKPDLLILKRGHPFMIIEVKARWTEAAIKTQEHIAEIYFELMGVDYFILATTEQLWLASFKQQGGFKQVAFNSLIELFQLKLPAGELRTTKEVIRRAFYEALKDSPEFRRQDKPGELSLEDFTQDEDFLAVLDYDEDGRFFHFSSEPGTLFDIEGQLFLELLEPIKETQVCRYTSLESLFQSLNCKSYRLASIIAMNDRSEIDYAYKQMNLFYKPLHSLSIWEMEELNKSFISSCTNIRKKDDLTMYRLYGDDSRGVCLVFDYDQDKERYNLLLRQVSYGEARKRHDKLDRLATFLQTLTATHRIRFRFMYFDTWKHFFKSSDYALEEEIRLLYIEKPGFKPDDQGWVKSYPDQIISRYVTFLLDHENFPLKLRSIVVGPNCPDAAVNKRQLEVMLKHRGITGVTVELSQIESYRKS